MNDSLKRFFESESAGGIVLLIATLAAILVANSSAEPVYAAALQTSLGPLSVEAWINDGLMALFFFVVGMEIKFELTKGSLASPAQASLPIVGAIGGMIVPALIFVALNHEGSTARGWGIPMATDIAFAVGVLSLFGRRIPNEIKVFLLALAIVDDLGAILVIAIFYAGELHVAYLAVAALGLGAIVFAKRLSLKWPGLFVALGVFVWWCVHHSGVHATIAGCALGFLVDDPRKWVAKLHAWSSFVIMPVFALANAGLQFKGVTADALLRDPLIGAISYGLFIGKPLGIFGACWIAVRLRVANFGGDFGLLLGAAFLGGIGFTMSLFIAGLALPPASLDLARLGIVKGSLLSALVGSLVLLLAGKTRRAHRP